MEKSSILILAMTKNNPVHQIIGRWPRRADLAGDIGVKVDRVHKWASSGVIPPGFQAAVVQAAMSRGIKVTPEEMLEAHRSANAAEHADGRVVD